MLRVAISYVFSCLDEFINLPFTYGWINNLIPLKKVHWKFHYFNKSGLSIWTVILKVVKRLNSEDLSRSWMHRIIIFWSNVTDRFRRNLFFNILECFRIKWCLNGVWNGKVGALKFIIVIELFNCRILRLNSGIFRILQLRLWNLNLTNSDCRTSKTFPMIPNPNPFPRDWTSEI